MKDKEKQWFEKRKKVYDQLLKDDFISSECHRALCSGDVNKIHRFIEKLRGENEEED